jgi:hypothetical protein
VTYHPGQTMGSPTATSMADACDTVDARLLVNAIEQVAFELRTANLIAYADHFGYIAGHLLEIETRLGINNESGNA